VHAHLRGQAHRLSGLGRGQGGQGLRVGLWLHARVVPLLVRHLRQAAGPRAQDQGRDL